MERAASSRASTVPARLDAYLGVHGTLSRVPKPTPLGPPARWRPDGQGWLLRRRDVDGLLEERDRPGDRACRTRPGPRARPSSQADPPRRLRPRSTKRSTSKGLWAVPEDGPDPYGGRSAWSSSSTRMTPWLAERETGLTTQGYPISRAAAAITSPGGDDTEVGLGDRRGGDSTAHDGLVPGGGHRVGRIVRQPEPLGRQAATTAPRSSTATTASSGARWWRSTTACTAAAVLSNGTTRARSPMERANACRRSDPTTTSTPRRRPPP